MYRNKMRIKFSFILLVLVFFCLFISDYANYNLYIDDNSSAQNRSISYDFGKFILDNFDIPASSITSTRTSSLTIDSSGRRCSKYLKFKMNTACSACSNSYLMHNSRITKINLEKWLTIKDCNIIINIDWINLKDGKKNISLFII